ncbi:MAG: glycosyltransferase family 9 protein [Gammaproteobacteria bacterium]|nr:glycosyltransferase family 9 protein [Gammaproteobacteria bacterium]
MTNNLNIVSGSLDHLCLLRLSAVGDICHTLPVVRTLQAHLPDTRITWIIGKTEYGLVSDIPGVNFVIFDKSLGLKAYWNVWRQLKGKRFDVLLHMQMSLRSSMLNLLVSAPVKIGFDKKRAKDMQWIFSNKKITHQPRQHVIDSFFGFTEALGISEHIYKWDIPIPAEAESFADQHLLHGKKVLVISPCSSMAYRNWSIAGYAAVAEYAVDKYDMQVVLTGGPSEIEKQFGDNISKIAKSKVTNLIGKTNLKQLLAVLNRATAVVSPDAGPAHMATAVNTPVIGLYATTNPDRARPYLSAEYTINHYQAALRDKYGKSVDEMSWGARVRDDGTMDRIKVDDVTSMLDKIMSAK